MDSNIWLDKIPADTFSRQDIYSSACKSKPGFRETQLRNLMAELLNSGAIVRVGRNLYQKPAGNCKGIYKSTLSPEALAAAGILKEKFPYMNCCIWELSLFNEFLVHLAGQNRIFVEADKESCEYVYSALADSYPGRVLLRPSQKELTYYGNKNCVIVDRLITEAPVKDSVNGSVSVEKMIVDLFANRYLRSMISKGDYPAMLENIFSKYAVDQTRLFRYARRRNKHRELADFIKEHTNIMLLTGI